MPTKVASHQDRQSKALETIAKEAAQIRQLLQQLADQQKPPVVK